MVYFNNRSMIVFILLAVISVSECHVVKTTSGPVRGKLLQYEDTPYYSFEGIPYAESPTGSLRFKPPVPKQPWTEVLNATKNGPVCYQPPGVLDKDIMMSEDCLYLNIHVPKNKNKRALPVLFFAHGGAYKSLSGNSDYYLGPEFLVQLDVILVTVNYRLGALGFLSLGIEEASGNAGLKDVLLALKWVNNNIECFGGDSERITLGGCSAGSAIAHALMLSEKTTGLFQQVILMSGTVTRFLANNEEQIVLALADYLDLNVSTIPKLLEELLSADPNDIIDAQENMLQDTRYIYEAFVPFVPNVEEDNPSAILTTMPRDIIQAGIPQNVPALVGFSSDEGIQFYGHKDFDELVQYLQEEPEFLIPPNIEYPVDSLRAINLMESISEFYFGDIYLSNLTTKNVINWSTDISYTFGIDDWIKLYKDTETSGPVYYYRFDFDGAYNWYKLQHDLKYPGVCHTDDMGYVFVTNVTKSLLQQDNPKSDKVLKIMTNLFANFVKYGNPTPYSIGGLVWPEAGQDRKHLVISDEPRVVDHAPRRDRMDFWYQVYDDYYQYLADGGETETRFIPL